jgi:hypothetical protein
MGGVLVYFLCEGFGNFIGRGISPVHNRVDGLARFVNFYKTFYGRG